MRWSKWIRQSHRWISIVFTLTVLANFVAMGVLEGDPPLWVNLMPLPFLFALLLSGLYLFVLPYLAKRDTQGAD
jgi:hypothetical protein